MPEDKFYGSDKASWK